jgi:hypothetical protein
LFSAANSAWDKGKNRLALKLFLQAAAQGDVYSFNSIGFFFDQGIGTKRDPESAIKWYRKAATAGDVPGCTNLALTYVHARNFRRARIWSLRALALGDADAALLLSRAYSQLLSSRGKALASSLLDRIQQSTEVDDEAKSEALRMLAELR